MPRSLASIGRQEWPVPAAGGILFGQVEEVQVRQERWLVGRGTESSVRCGHRALVELIFPHSLAS